MKSFLTLKFSGRNVYKNSNVILKVSNLMPVPLLVNEVFLNDLIQFLEILALMLRYLRIHAEIKDPLPYVAFILPRNLII